MRKKVSLKDIAKQTGVSTALISYILNDKFPNRINPETSRRVKQLAKELNYYPNQVAKSLKNNKTLMLGLIVADISNLFYSSIARVIEDEAKVHGYNVLFSSADENLEKFSELVQVYMNRQVDCIILACPEGAEEKLIYLKEQNIPFVMIDRHFPSLEEMNSVIIDNYNASYSVVQHLADEGYKRPAMITLDSNLYHLQERVDGFCEATRCLLKNRKPMVKKIAENELSARIESVILDLLNGKTCYDSIYFATNKIAIEGLAVIAKHGIPIPEKAGVVCFDEVDAYKLFHKTITYVRQPLDRIGKSAVELTFSRINGSDETQKVVLDTTLVVGETSKRK